LIFSTLGLDAHGQLLILALLVTIGIIENALGMLLVDRFPRQKFMAVGMLGCVAAFATEAGIVAQYAGSNDANALRAGIAMMFVFGVFYSVSLHIIRACNFSSIDTYRSLASMVRNSVSLPRSGPPISEPRVSAWV
jgi:hypothetical protein